MKAMVLAGIKQMEMREVPDPVLTSSTDVLIKMSTVGVCGSDVHYYVTGRIGSQVVKYPFIVGHEGAGIVKEVGSKVTRIKPGDRVAIDPSMPCRECDQCKIGRLHTCLNLRFLGCPEQADGCLSEYIVIPEKSCFVIRETMTMEQAAISEPLSIGLYSVKQSIPIEGANIGILGIGPIGASVLLAARAKGAEKIYVTDRIDARLEIARKAGADWTGNPDRDDIVEAITTEEFSLLDVVFECCGQQEALDQAIKLLKPGGKLMLIGIPTADRVSFSIHDMRRQEICVQNVRRQVECVREALDMIDNGDIDLDFMVTHRFSFSHSKEAFDLVAEYGDGVLKAMIEFE
jgi:L-iditol 2-dehydrogenase